MTTTTNDGERIHEQVRQRYADAALQVLERERDVAVGCCGPSATEATCCEPAPVETETGFGRRLYEAIELEAVPSAASLASLGCGNPVAVAELHEGETVLDLGSGGGIDVLLSARRVGDTGYAYGLDMTDEMLQLARRNAAEAGATNVEFVKGTIEQVPLPDASIDVVISNCVVNLAADKGAVFGEVARVLRPGGRIGITDIVAEDHLTPQQRAERGDYVGCIAGALSVSEFRAGLEAAGLVDVVVEPTHAVAAGMHSAIIRATRPASTAADGPG
ncbi:MAG: arsenite methyltransferase, partial [Candidatus Limnocylindrales bacterium]